MLIIDGRLSDAEIDQAINRFSALVTERGGEIDNTDRWGRRRLAQEIAGVFEGFYVIFSYRLDPARLTEVDKALPFLEGLVRSKTVRPEARARGAAS
jgi:small subunit ribosomal protein S6